MSDRRLWLQEGGRSSRTKRDEKGESYQDIFDRFARRPQLVSLQSIVSSSHVVGQELILTCLFLACHRTISAPEPHHHFEVVTRIIQPSLFLVWSAFFLVVLHNQPGPHVQQTRQIKIRHRSADGLFMAILLRFLAAVIKTLTASYSTDTVYALAVSCFVLHLLACDYSYANGGGVGVPFVDTTKRPAFEGGTLSLTAAFFATTLLASRLESNVTVYIFVSSSVILFALYPAARHQVTINTQKTKPWGKHLGCHTTVLYLVPVSQLNFRIMSCHASVPLAISALLALATFRLLSIVETITILVTLMIICVLVPIRKYFLQQQKVILVGPWVLVHPTTDTTRNDPSPGIDK
jgi:Phosphatidylinositol N-acetylglucosaminyltransferase